MSHSKLCLVGCQKKYPAFDSVSAIAKDVLGAQNVLEIRSRNPNIDVGFFKPVIYFFADISILLKIAKLHKTKKIQSLLIFQEYWPISSVGLRIMKIRSAIYVGGSSFEWSYMENRGLIGKLLAYSNLSIERICHFSANMIITLSPSMDKMLSADCVSKTFYALPRLDKSFMREFKMIKTYEERENIVGYVGGLSRRKGVQNLLNAIPLVISKKKCKFLIVGQGSMLKNVNTTVERLGIGHVVQVSGFIDYDSLCDCYNNMKVLAIPSYAEGIPSTIFEAMACGTPVLSTSVGGIPDLIRDRETGFLLNSNDPTEIAAKIIEVLENPSILTKIITSAYDKVKEKQLESSQSWRRILLYLNRNTPN